MYIIPINIGKDGSYSVHVIPSIDGKSLQFPSFSLDDGCTRDVITSKLPAGLLMPHVDSALYVRVVPYTAEGKSYALVAGDEQCFAATPEDKKNAWISQTNFVFGPLPLNADAATLNKYLYIDANHGSMSASDTIALATAMHAVRAKRLGAGISDESSVTMALIIQSAEHATTLFDSSIDKGMRKLTAAVNGKPQLTEWKRITQLVQRLATQVAKELSVMAQHTVNAREEVAQLRLQVERALSEAAAARLQTEAALGEAAAARQQTERAISNSSPAVGIEVGYRHKKPDQAAAVANAKKATAGRRHSGMVGKPA